MNKSNVLAIGVILVALGLYLQMMYNNREGSFRSTIEGLGITDENTFVSITTILFWAGLIVVIVSIVIRSKRRIMVPVEAVEETPQRVEEASYKSEEVVEKGEEESEQFYGEYSQTPEEVGEEAVEEAMEEEAIGGEEKLGKVGEVIGFCPRCGAPVTEGVRYCRKCGLKLR